MIENPEKPRGRRPSASISSRSARNRVWAKYLKQAESRGHIWALSAEDFDRLTAQDCHYCGLIPSNTARNRRSVWVYSGIDRMDNTCGYTLNNVVSCCRTCNILKARMPYAEFIAYLNRVSGFRKAQAVSA